ncbi:MAG TPA: hypothetical protein VGP66_02205, partial [Candidatus Acidoferrum sp.]|nr:hypothetical protein [Candidatus Acidoferrum sp.]
CEQLAIHYERKTKDIEQALAFAQLALAKLQRQRTVSRDPYARERTRRREEKLMCRVERLRHRIDRSNATAQAPLLAKRAAAGGSVR